MTQQSTITFYLRDICHASKELQALGMLFCFAYSGCEKPVVMMHYSHQIKQPLPQKTCLSVLAPVGQFFWPGLLTGEDVI